MNAVIEAQPAGWARPVTARNRRADLGLAALLLAGVGITLPLFAWGQTGVPPLWFLVVWALLITLPLALRRRFPATVGVVVIVTFIAGQALRVPEGLISQIALFIALYTLGAWGTDRRRSIAVRAVLLGGMLAWLGVAFAVASRDDLRLGGMPYAAALTLTALSTVLYLVAAVAMGEIARRSALRQASLELRTAELVAERARREAQAVTLERLRIARELHDVVAHHVSLIGIQAGAARRVLATDPDQASSGLSAIEQNARTAVDDLHRTLLTLRGDDAAEAGPPSAASSTLGVEQLTQLVAESEQGGTPTTLTVLGHPCRLPASTGLILYRVAQEALTNVRKHAGPGARAEVRLQYADHAVELVVDDAGGTRPAPAARSNGAVPGIGLGQVGMRERLATVDGRLSTGPTPGGYRVRALVPLR